MNPAVTERTRVPVLEPGTISEQERRVLAHLASLLPSDSQQVLHPPVLMGPGGERIELPASLCNVLQQAIPLLASGEDVAIVPIQKALTTQEAADILNVSRQYVVRLAEEGKLPFFRTGTHRRIRYEDVVAYKKTRDRERRQGLRRLTQMSRALGLYDEPDTHSA